MMIGTRERERSSRATSRPSPSGRFRSSSTRSGASRSNSSSALAAVAATVATKPSRPSIRANGSAIELSSSTSRIRGWATTARVLAQRTADIRLCQGFPPRCRGVSAPKRTMPSMKPKRTHIAAAGTMVALGALAAVAIGAGARPAGQDRLRPQGPAGRGPHRRRASHDSRRPAPEAQEAEAGGGAAGPGRDRAPGADRPGARARPAADVPPGRHQARPGRVEAAEDGARAVAAARAASTRTAASTRAAAMTDARSQTRRSGAARRSPSTRPRQRCSRSSGAHSASAWRRAMTRASGRSAPRSRRPPPTTTRAGRRRRSGPPPSGHVIKTSQPAAPVPQAPAHPPPTPPVTTPARGTMPDTNSHLHAAAVPTGRPQGRHRQDPHGLPQAEPGPRVRSRWARSSPASSDCSACAWRRARTRRSAPKKQVAVVQPHKVLVRKVVITKKITIIKPPKTVAPRRHRAVRPTRPRRHTELQRPRAGVHGAGADLHARSRPGARAGPGPGRDRHVLNSADIQQILRHRL